MSTPTLTLVLTNGYPYPFPEGLSPEDEAAISENSVNVRFTINGVTSFEWIHDLLVEVEDAEVYEHLRLNGWQEWSPGVLQAPVSAGDGYGHPAIIVGDTAYCGFKLGE